MNNKIVVCIGKGGQKDMAESFSRRTGSPIVNKPGDYLTVLFDSKGVSLSGFGLSYQGDFENMLHRVTNGRLQHEMLAKAVKTDQENLKAIDATAGMGEDSLLLAACGYQVTLYEQKSCNCHSAQRCSPPCKKKYCPKGYCIPHAACRRGQH